MHIAPSGRSERQLPFVGEQREKCLYVSGIPTDWDEWCLFDVFHRIAIVDNIILPRNAEGGQYGYGFVDMMTLAGVESVKERLDAGGRMNVDNLDHPLEVSCAREKRDQHNHGAKNADHASTRQSHRQCMSRESGTAECADRQLPDGQQKQGGAHRSSSIVGVGDATAINRGGRSVNWISELGARSKALPRHGSCDGFRFNAAIHRNADLPRKRTTPVEIVVSPVGIRNSPPVFYVILKESDMEDDVKLEAMLEEHFTTKKPADHVEVEELVVIKHEDSCVGDRLLRALVTDVKGSEVTVFALDTAERFIVPLSHLRPFTSALTRMQFKAIPCSFFGISAMKEKFAETAFRLLQWAKSNTEVKVKLISFNGFFNLVQVFIAEGYCNIKELKLRGRLFLP
uniref:RRM domain-containing protein n=1 Tax=Parascaris univalens TaxID=6257 RepID=A0A914ZMH7_PARUN